MNITLPRAVIQQALEAIESDTLKFSAWTEKMLAAASALRTALGHQYMTNAAGELEPVTVVQTGVGIGKPEPVREVWCGCGDSIMPDSGAKCGNCVAAERQWPLSDDEIQAIWKKTFASGSPPNTFARAIEAAHNIKE